MQADAGSGRILVKVEEGPRCVCGKVKVRGTTKAVANAITRRLTVESEPAVSGHRIFEFMDQAPASAVADGAEPAEPGKIESLWAKGQPAHLSEYDLRWLEWQARQALGDCGFFFPEVRVAIQRDPAAGKAELEVKVIKEGPRRTIGSIQISGNKKNSQEALLRYLELKPGMELTRGRLSGIEDRLWRAARFLSYQVTPGQPDTAGRVALRIEVAEYDEAPPVDQEFSPAEQVMLRLRQWLATVDKRQEEMILNLSTDLVPLPGLEMIVAPQGGLAVLEMPAAQSPLSQRPSGFVLKPGLAGFYDPARDRKLAVPWHEKQISSLLTFVPATPEGKATASHFTLSMGAGYDEDAEAAKVPYRLQVTLYPVACVSLAHYTNSAYWFDGGLLIRSNATLLWKLDARTGRPIELSWKNQVMETTLQARLRFQRKVFRGRVKEIERSGAGLANAYRTNAPLSSSLGFLTEELLSSKLLAQLLSSHVSSNALTGLPALAGKLNPQDILSPLDNLLSPDSATAKGQEYFVVPEAGASSGAGSLACIAAWFTRFSDQLLPAHSWPLTLAHEAGLVVQGKGKYTGQALTAIYESPDTGPLGYWAASGLLARVQPAPARKFAARGLERLSAADFRRDCQLFLQDNSPLGQSLGKLAASLGNLDDEDLRGLAAWSSPAFQVFLRESARSLRQAKGQTVINALAPALDVYWENELRQKTAAALASLDAQLAVQEGYASWQAQPPDYAHAARSLREAAERGNAYGQNALGVLYRDGLGVEKDYAKAVEWFRKAADQGYAEAQKNLGWAYANGEGVATDAGEAVRWYRKAADQGNAEAQNYLGWMYANGEGVVKDAGEAVQWYRKAAEGGNADAMNSLAWRLATCVIPEVRDGSGATSFAEKAVAATNRKDPTMLDTLAAAYAEAGRFAKAADAEKEAIALVSDGKTKNDYLSRLKLYESNTPYRQREQ